MCLVIVALVWALPLWDQVAGTGNLGRVSARGGDGGRAVGWVTGVRIMAESVFLPPFAVPGSMGDLLRIGGRPSAIASVGALAVCGRAAGAGAGALGLVVARGDGRGRARGAGVGGGRRGADPTDQPFGVVAQNYYWLWPVGVFGR